MKPYKINKTTDYSYLENYSSCTASVGHAHTLELALSQHLQFALTLEEYDF
jgi:hypothetical protein